MKKYPHFLLYLTLAISGIASAKSIHIECKKNEADGITLFAHFPKKIQKINLKDRDSCGVEYIYDADFDDENQGILIAGPQELGLRAKNDIYRISFTTNSSTLIGQIPSSAENLGNRNFRNIEQEGGSLFLERYSIEKNDIKTAETTPELIFDGILCVDNPKNIYNLSLNEGHVCNKKKRASKKHPLCVVHEANLHYLMPSFSCKELNQRWKGK